MAVVEPITAYVTEDRMLNRLNRRDPFKPEHRKWCGKFRDRQVIFRLYKDQAKGMKAAMLGLEEVYRRIYSGLTKADH